MFKLFKIFKNNKCDLPPPGLYTSLASEMVSIYLERKRRKRKVMFKLFKKKEMWTTAYNSFWWIMDHGGNNTTRELSK